MKYTGTHGYIKVDGVKLPFASSWNMNVSEGDVFGAPGDDGFDVHSVSSSVFSDLNGDLPFKRGEYVALDLLEGGDSLIYHELIECRVVSISYGGASAGKIVKRSVEFETIKPKVVKDVIVV